MDRRGLIRAVGAAVLAACSRAPATRPSTEPTTGRSPFAGPSPSASPSPGSSSTEPHLAPSGQPEAGPSESGPSEAGPSEAGPSESGPSADPEPTVEPEPSPEPSGSPDPEPVASPASGAASFEEICRESLGLPEPRPDDRRHTIAGLMLHHTAAPSDSAAQAPGRLRSHTRFHRDQGWPDIAYHVGVDLDGNVYGLRDTALPGDTFTEYDPSGWFLLVAEGDFNRTTPTPELLESAARVFAWAATHFGVSVDTLAGHRDAAATSCPGDQLYGALGSIRDRARELVAGTTRSVLCGAEGDDRVRQIEAG